jgi:hypothetical protein
MAKNGKKLAELATGARTFVSVNRRTFDLTLSFEVGDLAAVQQALAEAGLERNTRQKPREGVDSGGAETWRETQYVRAVSVDLSLA